MSDTFEPCPFCGEKVERWSFDSVKHSDTVCALKNLEFDEHAWNRRVESKAPEGLVWTREKPEVWFKYRWTDDPKEEYFIQVGKIGWEHAEKMNGGRVIEFYGPVPAPTQAKEQP